MVPSIFAVNTLHEKLQELIKCPYPGEICDPVMIDSDKLHL